MLIVSLVPRPAAANVRGLPRGAQTCADAHRSQVHERPTHRSLHASHAVECVRWLSVRLADRHPYAVPVARAQDEAKPGSGRVWLDDNDPLVLRGTDTKFTSQVKPRSRIALPKSAGSLSAEVAEVVSDTELKLKKEFAAENSKGATKIREKIAEAQATGKAGLDYKVVPHIDQQEMFRHVYNTLKEGGCVGIFPEGMRRPCRAGAWRSSLALGGSHDRADFLPFKAGVALMGLGAMAANPELTVRIQPVGLSYFHAHKFRSRAVVEFGTALDIPRELVDMFKEGGDKKREASTKLLDIIYDALKTVTFRAPDYDTLMVRITLYRLAT